MKLYRLTPSIFFVALVFFMGGNGLLAITDPVESNYALTAKEMVQSGNWLSPQIYGHFWYDKPIMIYWFIALGYKIFGIADWVARLPGALFGALSVAMMYQGMRSSTNRWVISLLSAAVLGTSLMFWVVAHGIVTDMILLFATAGTILYSYRGLVEDKPNAMIGAYMFAAIGVLTKGPVAIVLPGLILLIFAGFMRSTTMLKRIFNWKGILLFLLISMPWYIYMYNTHGQAFLDGFLGLNNVTRATESEHPEDNFWWYYIVIFLGAQLPWTGAIIYGMIKGWKRRTPAYIYHMTWGVGTIILYSLMATKYPLYTFISVIPFSIIGAFGIMKALRPGHSRKTAWVIIGPTILLWLAYCIGSFFIQWGFWVLLYVLVGALIIGLVHALYVNNRYMISVLVIVGTMLVSAIVLFEGLTPLVINRSSVPILPIVDAFHGEVYYYDGYSTSLVYYTGQNVVKIDPDENLLAKKSTGRSKEWEKKYLMDHISEAQFLESLKRGDQMMLIVSKKDFDNFKAGSIYPYVKLYTETQSSLIYIINSKTSIYQ